MKEPAHLALHPFGQIPTYEDGDLALSSPARSCSTSPSATRACCRTTRDARARAIAWMFAALSTVEPPIVERSMATLVERDKPWYEARLPMLDERVRDRLRQLSARLGDADWLDGAFSAGDLMMVAVLRGWAAPACWRNTRTSPPTSPAPKPGRPSSAPSRRSWRCSPASRRLTRFT